MKKFLLSVITLLLAVCVLLSACGGDGDSTYASAESSASFADSTSADSYDLYSAVNSEETADSFSETSEDSESVDPVYTSGGFEYTVADGKARLVGCTAGETEITLPSELDGYPLASVEKGAFDRVGEKLKKLDTGDAAVSLAEGAMSSCTALEALVIGGRTAAFQTSDLDGLLSLKEINVAESNNAYSAKDGMLYSGDGKQLLLCPRAFPEEEIELPEGAAVAERAFAECASLKKVSVPDGCVLGAQAFFHCVNLEEVSFEGSVEDIPDKCFFGCVKLKSISLPEGVKSVGGLSFFGCVALEEAELPSTVESIGDDVFKYCQALKKIGVKGDYASSWYEKTGKDFVN